MRALLTFLLLAAPLTARADADDLLARGHFAKGVDLYNTGHYDGALQEFEAARAARPLPAFDFNIAQCLDHLGQKAQAAVVFRRYLAANISPREAAQVQERIRVLENEPLALMPVPSSALSVTELADVPRLPPPKPKPRRMLLPWLLTGGAAAVGVVGVGLLGSAAADYQSLHKTCAPLCQTAAWAGLPAREHAGEAMLGIAGGAAVVGVVIWIVEARKK